MTHDELLAKLSNDENGYAGSTPLQRIYALRAVVELHKPVEEDGKLWCKHEVCYNHLEFLERDDCYCEYPCPTIKAIEKELN